jgi:hypothetical protein
MLSYKDKIEACILAFAANLVPEIVLLSILIGRPSRVLIKRFAKSNPSKQM